VSTLSSFVSQAIIVPITNPGRFTKRRAKLGNAPILGSVFPPLAITPSSVHKSLHILSPADDFMLQETAELLGQLQQKCQQLGIVEDEFTLSLQGEKFALNSKQAQHQQLVTLLQQDKSFMDKVSWLQPNYLALANSREWLSFADSYEVSRAQACQRFVHLQQQNQGLHCYLRKQGKQVDFVLESPINLFKVGLE
jgi:hypothetical protein